MKHQFSDDWSRLGSSTETKDAGGKEPPRPAGEAGMDHKERE